MKPADLVVGMWVMSAAEHWREKLAVKPRQIGGVPRNADGTYRVNFMDWSHRDVEPDHEFERIPPPHGEGDHEMIPLARIKKVLTESEVYHAKMAASAQRQAEKAKKAKKRRMYEQWVRNHKAEESAIRLLRSSLEWEFKISFRGDGS